MSFKAFAAELTAHSSSETTGGQTACSVTKDCLSPAESKSLVYSAPKVSSQRFM